MRESFELSLYGAVILGALLACKGGDKSSSGDSKAAEATAQAADTKPIVVKAADLNRDYQANEVAADEKYKGKRLRVVGILASIDKDAFDNIILRIKADGALLGVMATVKDSEKPKVVKLAKEQGVVVECKGGGMVMGTPTLDDCTVLIEGNVTTPAKK
jgi:tRNA_anti-like